MIFELWEIIKKIIGFTVLVLLCLFCWGWVSNVVLGPMTTGQYIRKLAVDFQQRMASESGKILKTKTRIVRDVQNWGRPII